MKKRLVYLVSGGGTNLQAVIDGIARGDINAESVEVISSSVKAYALERAAKHGIPSKVFALSDFGGDRDRRDESLKTELERLNPDYILLLGYLGVLPESITDRFPYRIVNIHPALLPKYGGKGFYGLNVHRAVIAGGEKISGATVHFVDGGTDTGLIIRSKSTFVAENDTAEDLQKRVLRDCEHPLIVETIKDLCDDKITVENGKIVLAEKR